MIFRTLLFLLIALAATGQQAKNIVSPDWTRPFPPFRIVGNVYYVGTWDLACYLITTPQGNILINTGLADSVPQLLANVESLGFRFSDIKILMATHGHWDHVSALAEVKRLTGARVLATEAETTLLESGGKTDFRFGADSFAWYAPVKVDERLKDQQKVSFGGMELTVQLHPGHTKGAASYSFNVKDGGHDYSVLIANMGSINPGVTLLDNANYSTIAADYARTFELQKALHPQIWLPSHASQFGLHEKFKTGDPYQPARFVDPEGYQKAVRQLESVYLKQLDQERGKK